MEKHFTGQITLYTSKWCAHSRSVERFLVKNQIDVEKISIDGDNQARQRLIEMNSGYASVPTLIFDDGTKLIEPSFSELRRKLGLQQPPGLVDRVRGLLNRNQESS